MHPNAYETLSEAVNELNKRGYNHNFSLDTEAISCDMIQKTYRPEEFTVIEYHRFEGNSDPADEAVVYAIEATDGTKGQLVAGYGAIGSHLKDELVQKLRMP